MTMIVEIKNATPARNRAAQRDHEVHVGVELVRRRVAEGKLEAAHATFEHYNLGDEHLRQSGLLFAEIRQHVKNDDRGVAELIATAHQLSYAERVEAGLTKALPASEIARRAAALAAAQAAGAVA